MRSSSTSWISQLQPEKITATKASAWYGYIPTPIRQACFCLSVGVLYISYRRGLTGVAYPRVGQCESPRGGISKNQIPHALFIWPRNYTLLYILAILGESMAQSCITSHAHRPTHQTTNGDARQDYFLACPRTGILPHKCLQDLWQEIHRHRPAAAHLPPASVWFLWGIFPRNGKECRGWVNI